MKVFCRDFLHKPDLVASFKFPRFSFKPKSIPTKKDLEYFYSSLPTLKDKALFLLYTTSGLRRMEILSLTIDEVDFDKRMIVPINHNGNSTKNSWVSFYNHETEQVLNQYLSTKNHHNHKLFPMTRSKLTKLWKDTREITKLNITPQRLREWFCVEMSELGVQDRYIDAFCGRTPKSVLARHYTDYSPERLKRIYDKANIKVLS
jgi:integrase